MEQLEKPTIESEVNPLVKFFESRGYENVRTTRIRSLNAILYATRDKKECFIKKFNPRDRSEELILGRIKTEMACYEHLPSDILIDVIEPNIEESYLVLKKVDLVDTGKDQQSFLEIMDLCLTRFPQIDASFLPQISWEHYEELFGKMKNVEAAGIIQGADSIIETFKDRKALLMNSRMVFSHQDFDRRNIKKADGKLKIFDFELSIRNNILADMAALYIDIKDEENLVDTFEKRIKESELYDEELFSLMIIRRGTLFVNSFVNKLEEAGKFKLLQNHIDILRETTSNHK